MAKVWNKIGHADKKYNSAGSILSLQIPVTWPSSNCDKDQIHALDNPEEAQHWRTVKTPQDIAFYLRLRNRLHSGTYSNSELTVLENILLDHCKKERDTDIISNEISV
eukprot:7697163-Ditylum_brightwellii.AAC.1